MARDLVAEREYQRSLDMLRILAQRDFVAWWEQAYRLGVLERQKQAVELLHAVASQYGEQAAYAAADYLFRSRQLDDVLARLDYPEVADPAGLEQAEASFGWALNTSRKEGVLDVELAKRKLAGVLNRLVLQPARETVAEATRVAGTRFARVPQPGACNFCLMLASRGDVYSEKTVLQRSRGGSYHDNCSCLAIEVQTPADLPVINQQLEELWAESTAGVSGSQAQRDAFAAAVQERRSRVDVTQQRASINVRNQARLARKVENERGNEAPAWVPSDAVLVEAKPKYATRVPSSRKTVSELLDLGLVDHPSVRRKGGLSKSEREAEEKEVSAVKVLEGALGGSDGVYRVARAQEIGLEGVKTPDFVVLGESVDIKTLDSIGGIKNRLRGASQQAEYAVFDARGLEVTAEKITENLIKAVDKQGHVVRGILVISNVGNFYWKGEK
ncbi:hypothetical protein CMUST_15775 (plasmid) [Corynebacterium mustelae]|uniref:tRNA nuclease CdiA C-terminal domain-containing protein n=1 Tax=Corynebacterium mustelae TaxID=571915 RepID=A0A0G3GVP7_9CORY|nr:hypothetical protein [Corynebacterium mustelae]AKK05231.1 hypothetical protein CMUST_04445 [Corynebacterium mustelae]AKK07443.1 hypothetical protein CMUST_15775 [Corynebacterium mustelae]